MYNMVEKVMDVAKIVQDNILLFLLITMIGGLLAGGVIDIFEETLDAVVVLAIFIPYLHNSF
ncbi:hypothetical protein SYNTR_1711 [Candidatus Syntrophocurvum alkaliphilum]|uniref:Uncharacterized protein n=1 Tax=Candidatus Syntrophocurvum alkaliphilum TaxID=2293317 RepID=A0A6I6DHQ1_9FIRM|nr:hypothetical protein [Candidatus Syntrophocurvum alkaliphilum]QGU00305.1 hypothetical protein SYNTR_1711 [Candidatus Syntrophocurvum alkaliphilum]